MAAPALLTVAEVATIWRRSRWYVNQRVKDGTFPIAAIDTMGIRQFRRVDIEEFLGVEITEDDLRPSQPESVAS